MVEEVSVVYNSVRGPPRPFQGPAHSWSPPAVWTCIPQGYSTPVGLRVAPAPGGPLPWHTPVDFTDPQCRYLVTWQLTDQELPPPVAVASCPGAGICNQR